MREVRRDYALRLRVVCNRRVISGHSTASMNRRSSVSLSISSSIAASVMMFAPMLAFHMARSSAASELGADASTALALVRRAGRNRATSTAAALAVTAASLSTL